MELPIVQIENLIGYVFKDKAYLVQAFTHSSYANIQNVCDNERMEFLGDAILSEIVSEYIFDNYPQFSAGELTKIRSKIVSAAALRPVVLEMGVLKYLIVASGSNGIKQSSKKIEANLYEAILCAIYLDGGYACASKFVFSTLQKTLTQAFGFAAADPKTVLQEYCQKNKRKIEYKLLAKSGPDNNPKFTCGLYVDGELLGRGEGGSKKAAEQDAAEQIIKDWRIK